MNRGARRTVRRAILARGLFVSLLFCDELWGARLSTMFGAERGGSITGNDGFIVDMGFPPDEANWTSFPRDLNGDVQA
jgi:hypothetical protein